MEIPKNYIESIETVNSIVECMEGAHSRVWFCPKCGQLCSYEEYPFNRLYGAIAIDCKCRQIEITRNKIKKYTEMSVFDSNYKFNTFANSKPFTEKEKQYMKKFKNFCDKFHTFGKKRVGMILFGTPGTGKTFYENCIVNELEAKGKICLAWNVSGYIRSIIDSYNNDSKDKALESKMLKAIEDVDLIILDDLGSEKLTDKGKEYLYNLVNQIYMKNKKLIISTNNDFYSLENHLKFNGSDKIVDRLKEICYPFHFDWDSRRGKNREELF